MESYILNLGSNKGPRFRSILSAIRRLTDFGKVAAISRLYLTEPIGPSWSWFLNVSLIFETHLLPLELLKVIKEIEIALGRTPSYRWGPREIDIDIILWDRGSFSSVELVIPHKSYKERAFVLVSLMDLGNLNNYGVGIDELKKLIDEVESKRVIPLYTASKYLYLEVKVGG